MKIYSRTEFMKLPEGIIFSSGEPYAFSGLYIKGETWKVDFLESDLINIDSFSSNDNAEKMYDMETKGNSYPINKSYGREGLFDDNILYLVYEKEDLEYLIKVLKQLVQD